MWPHFFDTNYVKEILGNVAEFVATEDVEVEMLDFLTRVRA